MVADVRLDRSRRRGRLALLLLFGLFFGSAALALLLRSTGWQPAASRQHGQLYSPAIDVRAEPPLHRDGRAYAWEPERRLWRVVIPLRAECDRACVDLSHNLHKVWQLQGRRADRLQVLWFGPLPPSAESFRALIPMHPEPQLEALLPQLARSGAPSVYLVDPRAFLVMRYAPGVDPGDVRADITQLLKS